MMEGDADGWPATKIDRSMSLNDLRNINETKFGDLTAPYSHSCREIESLDSSVIYTDKNVMECELPELIVCYKENTFHVKDICIDEGVHLQKSNIMLPSEKGSESMEVKNKSDEPLPYMMESWTDNVSSNDKVDKRDCSPCNVLGNGVDRVNSMDLLQIEKPKDDSTDRIANIESTKIISLADLLSIQDPVLEKPYSGSLTKNGTDLDKNSSEGSSGKAVSENHVLVSTTEKSDDSEEAVASSDLVPAAEVSNGGGDKAVLVIPAENPAVKEKINESIEGNLTSSGIDSPSEDSAKSNNSDKLSYNSKVETGTITFDFDPSAPKANRTEDCPNSGESTPVENPDTSKLEDAPRQSFSSQANGSLGESSFHVSGSIPSLITYSGAVPFSGNLSIRSDSSTTSTRSFAFPVLQSEWSTSPVRMAKADRRSFRKHKCWRQGLLCCRF